MPIDKLLHVLVGYVMASALIAVGTTMLVAVITVSVVAIGYEVRQLWRHRGQPEVLDAVGTIAGGLLAAVLMGVHSAC